MYSGENIVREFDYRGNLKTVVSFRFLGQIAKVSLRKIKTTNIDGRETESYAISMTDVWGFEMSYWSKSLNLDRASKMLSKMPVGTDVLLTGDVNVKKGRTYFNVKRFQYPDETDVEFFLYGGSDAPYAEEEKEMPL